MAYIHPKLVEIVVDQTPRAMIAMLIVSSAYCYIFFNYIPLLILFVWLVFQLLLAVMRLYNVKKFKQHITQQDMDGISNNRKLFTALNIFQALMWTISSILVSIYAPEPFELVSFIMIIGIITAAALSMSSLYKAYLIFFFCMITPQIVILLYHGEQQHIGVVIFTMIYIPATILLSKAIFNSRVSSIEAHDELAEKAEELHQLSITDSLTHIYNRRYFFSVCDDIILIAEREKQKISLLMIDVDHFKGVNDSYGHQAGDFVLINLVKNIQHLMRKSDVFARVGGEEFAILLNNTSLDKATVVAEKIRAMVENSVFMYNSVAIKITLSIGISELNQENNSIEQLFKKADNQLYGAKHNGRNRVKT
ncbi:GGDEF domain-containing protein [Thalassotalea piscium]